MDDPLTECAISVLRREPAGVVNFDHLYHVLATNAEPHPGPPQRLRECLKRRPDVFLLLEAPTSYWSADWPDEQRNEYQAALREAGIGTGPSVALLEAGRPAAQDSLGPADSALAAGPIGGGANRSLRALEETLVALGAAWARDPELQAEIASAVAQAGQLRTVLGRGGGD